MKLVFIDNAKSGMTLARDVIDEDGSMIALARKGTVLTDPIIQRIIGCGINSLYIIEPKVAPEHKVHTPNTQYTANKQNTQNKPNTSGTPNVHNAPKVPNVPNTQNTRTVVKTPAVASTRKTGPIIGGQLRDEAIESLKEIFSHDFIQSRDRHESIKIIRHLEKVTERLVDALMNDTRAFVNIIELKSYDEYTYHHSLSVAVLSVAVAQHCGFERDELIRIGKSAMLHDIGKTSVPLEIIQKNRKLDEGERAIINNHSRAGCDYLNATGIFDKDICNAVLCHHERFDGTGYPCGLKGGDIPLWSRIIAVADVYDALTSNRPYRQPMQPAEAVEYIMGGAGSLFDFEIVKAFTKRLEPYPKGSNVELSDGQIAEILDTEHPTRPIVRVVKTGEIMDLFGDQRRFNIVINRIVEDD